MAETNWKKVVIAYEPIWAFNTGKIASADQTQEATEIIRDWLRENVSDQVAEDIRVLYGGPVTEMNTENLIKLPGVDGFLIGTTSCKPVFRNIFGLIHKQALKDFAEAEDEF